MGSGRLVPLLPPDTLGCLRGASGRRIPAWGLCFPLSRAQAWGPGEGCTASAAQRAWSLPRCSWELANVCPYTGCAGFHSLVTNVDSGQHPAGDCQAQLRGLLPVAPAQSPALGVVEGDTPPPSSTDPEESGAVPREGAPCPPPSTASVGPPQMRRGMGVVLGTQQRAGLIQAGTLGWASGQRVPSGQNACPLPPLQREQLGGGEGGLATPRAQCDVTSLWSWWGRTGVTGLSMGWVPVGYGCVGVSGMPPSPAVTPARACPSPRVMVDA